jgi:acyl-CoA hydrolase/RimJ/RimL family protein N-acetyltransferase
MTSRWKDHIVMPQRALNFLEPGMTIFLGSGLAEPRTLLNALMSSDHSNTNDIALIQLNSHSDILSLKNLDFQNYRLKTFFSGWVASEIAEADTIDLIPARYSQIPHIFRSKQIPIDAAFIQITPPDPSGFCSLGMAVDVAREVMEQASLVIGEINDQTPFTFGDTIVSITDFDMLVKSDRPPFIFRRRPVSDIVGQVASNIASLIDDGDCIGFHTASSLFEGLCRCLENKRHLGIHSPYFTDALMDLVRSGAVSNYKKTYLRGKSIASYALGTPELAAWLHRNPVVELQSIAEVCSPLRIGSNPNFTAVFHAKKVDLLGRVTFDIGKGSLTSGPGIAADIISGAELSVNGKIIFGLPCRDIRGESNIIPMLTDQRNQFHMRESIGSVVTEYGVANLKWRSIRERAQALIDIAHPEDRAKLVAQAKQKKIIFPDQIFLSHSAKLYPNKEVIHHTFKNGLRVLFRAIKPSDEEAMRRLFYRFSSETVYRRFFYPITTMPHVKMQEYVNIDYKRVLSIVALVGETDEERIIAEARFVKDDQTAFADVAFVVDERYQGLGIGTYLFKMLIRLAKERKLKGFTAEVLLENEKMIGIFEKAGLPVTKKFQEGIYQIKMPFTQAQRV